MHIPIQSSPHSNNNKAVQYAYSIELQHLPTFPTSLQEIHTRSGEVIDQGAIETMEEKEAFTWPYPQEDEINMACITFDEGQTLEPEYSPSPNTYSLCILEFDERSRDMKNEEENPEYKDYIEIWFHEVTKPQYHSFLQFFLLLNQTSRLVLHIQVITTIIFLYVDKGIFLILLRTWLHWKNSYT